MDDDYNDNEYVNEEDEDYNEDQYEEEQDLDQYKSPGDDINFNEDDENIYAEDSYIDTGAEWRDFSDSGDASKSRVGMARALDIDEDLSTLIEGDKFKKFNQMSRTPEDIFKTIVLDTISSYNISKDENIYDDSMRIMQLINKHNKRLKYRNPKAIVFALLVFSDRKIDKKKLDKVYDEKAKHEHMTKIDLLRYVFFIENLRKL